jgi:hypothetical protein
MSRIRTASNDNIDSGRAIERAIAAEAGMLKSFFALRRNLFQVHIVEKTSLQDKALELWNRTTESSETTDSLDRLRRFQAILVEFWRIVKAYYCNEDQARIIEIKRESTVVVEDGAPLSWTIYGLENTTRFYHPRKPYK